MTALKGEAIDRFLRKPDRPLALVYGPDVGLVGERAAAIIAAYLGADPDPMARTSILGDTLQSAPHLLAEEAHSVPMFGGRRAVRVTATSRNIAAAVEPLLRDPSRDAIVVVEAGDLKPSSPLRRAVEKADAAVALPCYVDDDRALEGLIAEEAAAAGLTVSSDARMALLRLIGGDRLASRGELRKLAAYCHGTGRIELEDVEAIAGDASALEIDTLIDAAAAGDSGAADAVLRRALSSGTAGAGIVSALARHFLQLSEARRRVDRGATAESAMRELKPPVFFKRQQSFRRQLGMWSPDAIGRALDLLRATEAELRLRSDLEAAVTARTLLALAGAASASGRR